MSLHISDSTSVSGLLSSPPFVVVPGVINIRAFGGTPSGSSNTRIKPLHVFRSGELTRIDATGKSKLRELGITTIFDLRSDSEIAQYSSATPELPGIRVLLGVSDADIAQDYALSAIGVAPAFQVLEARFRTVPAFRENWEGAVNMGTAR
ncbi:hypothetical protein H0H87_007219 [Tephrocybe sp. NHM501043]|nr:hypothetical protein H0H87_007219 [Tephrocybe sp. NHM501043]